MEPPIQGRHKAPKLITTMPDNVLTNILDRLPLQDAVKTGILARNWRFKWTMLISHLVLDYDFFYYLRYTKAESLPERVIGRILLQLRGAITKCVLSVGKDLDVEDVIHWISFLSRKGIKDFTLSYRHEEPFKLPIHLLSCLELKRMKFYNCCFTPPPPGFHGFPNLLSLELGGEISGLGEVTTRCPLLEILNLDDVSYSSELKLDEIAKLENLKVLSLSLCNLDTTISLHSSSTIIELLGSLPKLQQLQLKFEDLELLKGVADKRFSITFPCLKALKLSQICLDNGMKLSCAFEIIMSCPNLQTLEITASECDEPLTPQVNYNTTGMYLHLRSVYFEYSKGSENELSLIKYLLASSPVLKNLEMFNFPYITRKKKQKFASKLLKLHRASPVAEIDFEF